MRISDRIDSEQILAVSLTLIMLISVGSVGFVGGVGTVGAQDATGGTHNEVFDERQSVSDELNVNTGDVFLVGPDSSGGDVDGVSTRLAGQPNRIDGQINIDSSDAVPDDGEFAGVEISPDRINASMASDTADPATPADFLNDIPNEFEVASRDGDAFPAIFIEYAPQSEFSQIEGSNSITNVSATANGEHDFIVIANSSDLVDITDTAGAGAADISGNGIVALSVDNDDVSGGTLNASNVSEATVLAEGSDFGTVASDLTGSDGTDLQNSNIDDIQFTAGLFGASDDDDRIRQVLLADDISTTDFDAGAGNHGETIHHEKITVDGSSYASIEAAEEVAESGERIDVDDGVYEQLEPDSLDIETQGLVLSGVNDAPGADRLPVILPSSPRFNPDETYISAHINANDTRGFTFENAVVSSATRDEVISIVDNDTSNDPRDPTLDSVIAIASPTNDGVTVETGSGSDATIIRDSVISSGTPSVPTANDVDDGQTGLNITELSEEPGDQTFENNLIIGFEKQVVDQGGNVNMSAFFANNRFETDERAHAALVLDEPRAAGGTLSSGDTIFGSIDAADAAATDGQVIDVYDATYEEDLSSSIATDTIDVIGDENVVIASTPGDVVFDGSGNVSIEAVTLIDDTGLDFNSSVATDSVTIDDVTVTDPSSSDNPNITITNTSADADVSVSNVTAPNFGGDFAFLNISAQDVGNVSVADSDITLLNTVTDAVGVDIDTTAGAVEDVTVTDTTVDATFAPGTPTGISVAVDGVTGTLDISENNVINASNGVGITYTTAGTNGAAGTGAGDGPLLVENNRISGGAELVAMDLEPVAEEGRIDGNALVGADVDGGVGLQTEGNLGSDLKNLILFDGERNTITGFETLVNSSLSTPSVYEVSNTYENAGLLGTHVISDEFEDGSSISESPTPGNIYGNLNTTNAALEPVNSVDNTFKLIITETTIDTSNSTLTSQSLHGNALPEDYVHDGEQVTLDTTLAEIDVEGPGGPGTDAPVVRNLAFQIEDGNDNLANHDIRDLRLNGTDGTTAIQVASVSNSQSTFERLAVTTTATGVDVSSQDDDVTVVEIRDSTFDVGGDGIVLADSADDRDGFVVDNVTLAGDNLTEDSDTGLDLSNVDTPGKEELPTELEVRGLDVSNFETQLQLSSALVTASDELDAQAVYEGSVSADGGDIIFENNNFAQAVFVNESFEEPKFTTTVTNLSSVSGVADVVFADTGLSATQERLADNQTIYGSITEADATGVDDYDFDNVTLQAVDSNGNVVPAPSDISFDVRVESSRFGLVEVDDVSIAENQPVEVDVDTASAVVDIRAAGQNPAAPDRLYAEDVVVGAGNTSAADELLVRGPQAGTAATDSLRGDEAIILGTLGDSRADPTNATTDITVDGLTTVAPHEYSVIEFQTDVDRFDASGPDRGDFEAGDEFVVDQQVDSGNTLSVGVIPSDLNLDDNPLEAPSAPDVATFDDSRDITVNNTAFSASVSEDRLVVNAPSGGDIDVERQSLNPTPDEIQTSAVGINVSSVGDVTIANSFVGDHTAVDTTGDSVVTSGGASATVVDSTLAPSTVSVSTVEEPTETTNTLLFDSIEGYDVDAATPPTAPVGVNAGGLDLTVSASDVTGHPGDGVLVNTTEGDVVLNESTTVTESGARGVGVTSGNNLTIDNTVVSNSTDTGVDVGADVDLSITEATIEDGSDTGVRLDATLTGAEISQTTIANNTASDDRASGLHLTTFVDAPNVTVRSNAFENNDFGISVAEGVDTSTETLDATLNYFGDRNGPAAAGGDSVTETVVYDPFLSADRTDTPPADIESTTGFAHDVIVPSANGERTFVAVGFPAQLEGVGLSGDATVDDYIDPSYEGNVYAFDKSSNSFTPVSGDTEIEAFDALVVENARTEDQDRVISLEYKDDRSPTALPDNRLTYDEGLNFVAPQQAGQVDEVLFPGGDTDAIVQPFAAGENLYGATSADQVRDQFVTLDGAQDVSTNFRSGAGDATVHPHVGYFVIVNENTNEGLTVTEGITVPDSPAADEIANRTDANSDVVATNAETGETYESLTAALSELNDFETLVLERGTLAPDRDELTITQDNVRLVGQGEAQTEIAADLVLNGSSIQLDAVDVVANSPTGEVTVLGAGASLNEVNAEDGIDIQADRTTVTGGSASTINVSADDADISGTSASSITVADGTTGVEISDTQTSEGITDNSENATVSDISPAAGSVVNADTGAAFDSIQAAENAANADETIRVGPGTFDESVTIDTEGLTLEGPNAGLAGDSDARGDEALINRTGTPVSGGSAVSITEAGVTVDGFQIESAAQNGISVDQPVNDTTIQNNRITSVAGNTFGSNSGLRATGNGITFGLPRDVSQTTVTGAVISDNVISGVTTEDLGTDKDRTTANGIQILTRQHNVEGMEITGNVISDLEAGTSGDTGDKRARGIIVNVGDNDGTIGAADRVTIADNDISGATGAGGFSDVTGVGLFEAGGAAGPSQDRVGPENFTVTNNQLDDLTNNGKDSAPAIFVGGIQTLGEDHSVTQNQIDDGSIIRFAGDQPGFDAATADSLNASGNTFTDENANFYYSDTTDAADLGTVIDDNEFPVEVDTDGAVIFPADRLIE